nr:T9SS type A sorting domain-containing protein [Bacteroidota bacterium]
MFGKYIWPNPDPLAESYDEEIANLKQWISGRINWLDDKISALNESSSVSGHWCSKITLSPNPARDCIYIRIDSDAISVRDIRIIALNGKTVYRADRPSLSYDRDGRLAYPVICRDFSSGVYLVPIGTENGVLREKLVKMD